MARFMYDGFFPGYYNNSDKKVLFIGKEPRCQELSQDYIYNTIEFFMNRSVNGAPYWKRIICMHDIIRNNGTIRNITADQIAKQTLNCNYGFAAMNISKYENLTDNSSYDPVRGKQFFHDSQLNIRNFLKEELVILEPDLIIVGNIWECGINAYLNDYFGKRKDFSINIMFKDYWEVALYEIELNNKPAKIMNFHHFADRISDTDFYEPLSFALQKNLV